MNLDELDQIIDRSTRAPLSESDGEKLKAALHAMAERLLREAEYGEDQRRSARRMQRPQASQKPAKLPPAGHGRNGAAAFTGAQTELPSRTPRSTPATAARNAARAKCTARRSRRRWCGFVGHAPLEATVFEMERLRCNACGQVFTAEEPEDGGPGEVR